MTTDPLDCERPAWAHDHIRIHGCYRCVLPEGETQDAVDAHAAVARVRALHHENGYGNCDHCIDAAPDEDFGWYAAEYPCPTIRALDGEA